MSDPTSAPSDVASREYSDSLSPDEFRRYGHEVVDWIANYLDTVQDFPVLPDMQPGDLIDRLPARGPDKGESMDQILADFRSEIVPAMTHWSHPRFFSFFSATASSAGILAEMLAAGTNMNGMVWQSSPASVELEQVTLAWLRDWCGLPSDFFGEIFDTASISSFHALIAARERIAPQSREEGMPAGLVAYASEYAHSSIEKGAITLGIGQRNFRKVPVDAAFRMRVDELERMIVEDKAKGLTPFFVAATIGTTSVTSVDPTAEVAAVAKRHGLWLHVDSAYAGSLAVSPDYQHLFEGWDQADSIVMNPHKWLFAPVDVSVFYLREPDVLRRALSIVPAYLKTADHPRVVNFMDYGIALGRRFRSLKLWFLMRSFGRERIAEIHHGHIQMAKRLAEEIEQDTRFELTAPVPLSAVCFRLKAEEATNIKLLQAVNGTRETFISQTRLGNLYTLRIAVGNIHTTMDDVLATWQLIQAEADKLLAA